MRLLFANQKLYHTNHQLLLVYFVVPSYVHTNEIHVYFFIGQTPLGVFFALKYYFCLLFSNSISLCVSIAIKTITMIQTYSH